MQKTLGKYSRSVQEIFKHRKTESGQAADWSVKKYKYGEVLQFLMPRIDERSTISSIEQPSENYSEMVNSQVMTSAGDETREEIIASNRNADIHQPKNPTKEEKKRTT